MICLASVEKKCGKYRLVARLGRGPDGSYIKKYRTIEIDERLRHLGPNQLKKELQNMAMLFENEIKNRKYVHNDNLTVKDIIEIWLEDYGVPNLMPKTLENYRIYLRRIIEELGHIKFAELQPRMITAFYKKLTKDGVRYDKSYSFRTNYIAEFKAHRAEIISNTGIHYATFKKLLAGGSTTPQVADKLSRCVGVPVKKLFYIAGGEGGLDPKSIRHHHRVLTAVFNRAIKWQLISSNPATHAEVPKVEKKEAKAYNEKQVVHMFHLLADEPIKYQAAVYVALYAGLRLGEVVGLDWFAIDFKTKTLSVTKARQYTLENGSYDKTTKTRSSIRKLNISDDVVYILEELKREQDQERQKLGDQWVESGKVFVQQNGAPMFIQTPSKWFTTWLRRMGLPHITFHQLRHTHASILLTKGVDVVTVSKRLGHSSVSTTMETYAHSFEENDSQAADLLDEVFSPEIKLIEFKNVR
jgi:integrase